jgi:oligopeptide/dipeptide ABC transporter ATP-binding protein
MKIILRLVICTSHWILVAGCWIKGQALGAGHTVHGDGILSSDLWFPMLVTGLIIYNLFGYIERASTRNVGAVFNREIKCCGWKPLPPKFSNGNLGFEYSQNNLFLRFYIKMTDQLLEVENLKMHFPIHGGIWRHRVGWVYAVDGVSLKVRQGETLGLVGESGCGKTTVGRTIARLYKPTAGKVEFDGKNLANLNHQELREVRRDLQMIFQDPFESLNARHTIQEILQEPFVIHKIGSPGDREAEIAQLLNRVGMDENTLIRFPHEFSGGQRQRIGIARAIALKPKMVICDEPVSALDVSIQSQILNLLLELQAEMKLTYLFIAHDLAVVKHISDRIAVMYLGKIVEYADADELYQNPVHPYTYALLSAIPIPDPDVKKEKQILSGDVPSPINPPSGCVFHTRCPYVKDSCKALVPELVPAPGTTDSDHLQACLRAGEIEFD